MSAATATEYFNGYGSSSIDISALNGGTGWAGPWTGGAATDYAPGAPLVYGGAGYQATGNESDADDGVATGTAAGTLSYRLLSAGLSGTIWISATTLQTSSGDILFWLDKTNVNVGTGTADRDFVGLRGTVGTTGVNSPPEPVIGYNGTSDDTSSTADFALNSTHLILLRIDMNYSAALDRLNVWFNPNLSGGELGLSTPDFVKSSLDAYGATFDGLGLSFSAITNQLDAIRLSNEADGFNFVTTGVPEPSTALLGSLAGGLILARRRRRTA